LLVVALGVRDMGMAEQDISPLPERRWGAARHFLQKNIGIVRAAEFALCAGFAAGAWFAGSDMFLAVPVLFLAWIVAVIGLMASSLVWRWIITWSIVFLLLFGGEGLILYWHFHGLKVLDAETTAASSPMSSGDKNDETRPPLSMRQLFDSDFVGLAKIAMQSVVQAKDSNYIFAYTQYFDLPTNSFFLAFFLGRTEVPFLNIVSCRLNNIIGQLGDEYFKINTPGDTRTITTDAAAFSKQIFLYFDDAPSIKEMDEIEGIFAARGYTVSFRTTDYKVMHWRELDRVPKGAEKGTMAVLPRPEAGMAVTVANKYSPSRDWFKGPPIECPLPPEPPKTSQ
jgi:hypothetical protein